MTPVNPDTLVWALDLKFFRDAGNTALVIQTACLLWNVCELT